MLKKYSFIPEHQLGEMVDTSAAFIVSVNKNGTIYFSPFVARIYDLEDKIVRLYADVEKKTIAWTEIKEGNLNTLKNVRQLKLNSKSKAIVIMVNKLLKKIGIEKSMLPIKNVPVTIYKDILVQDDFHVIDLSKYAIRKKDE